MNTKNWQKLTPLFLRYRLEILYFMVFIEFSMFLFISKLPQKEWASVVYFLAGIIAGLLYINGIKYTTKVKPIINNKIALIYYLILSIGIGYFLYVVNNLFNAYPLNYKWADMLPIMKIMAERFVKGENPYQKINEIWGGMPPIYLPTMWLCYTIPILLKTDIRWVNIIVMLIGLLLFLYKQKKNITQYDFLTLFIVLYFLIESLHHKNQDWYILTEEPLVAGYYLILAYALKRKNPIFIGFAVSLCLMSRYGLLFWFIAYLFFVFRDKQTFFKIFITTGVVCLLLFVVTNAFTQLSVFLDTPQGYVQLMLSEKAEGIYATTVKESLGVAKFFALNHLKYLHTISLIVLFIVPFLLFTIYRKMYRCSNRNKYALGILKISLVCFYNLLIVPCHYLFITSTLFSIALLNTNVKE